MEPIARVYQATNERAEALRHEIDVSYYAGELVWPTRNRHTFTLRTRGGDISAGVIDNSWSPSKIEPDLTTEAGRELDRFLGAFE